VAARIARRARHSPHGGVRFDAPHGRVCDLRDLIARLDDSCGLHLIYKTNGRRRDGHLARFWSVVSSPLPHEEAALDRAGSGVYG
jgi:hypothetical protein